MNKKVIRILVALVTCVLIGMVALQLRWISTSMSLRKAEFQFEINAVLDDVVLELEKKENLEKGGFTRENMPLLIELTSESSAVRAEDLAEKTLQSANQNIKINGNSTPNQDPSASLENKFGDFGVEQSEILSQTEFINDIMAGNATMKIVKSMEERLDFEVIDSLIKGGLYQRKINTPFVFGIFKGADLLSLQAAAADFSEQLKGTLNTYQTKLFPKDHSEDTYFLKLFFPKQNQFLFHSMDTLLLMSILILIAIFAAFYYSIKTIFKQKKLGEMKNDFINNMTHELKTPISTISLACEALKDPDMRRSENQMNNYINMINSENKRLGILVENVLKSALLESEEMPVKINKVDLHEVIRSVVKSLAIRVKKYQGKITTDLAAQSSIIEGDSVHLTNMVYNLIDNAIKYSPEGPVIRISTQSLENEMEISVSDKGIGIQKENQKKIFDKLYRVPTGNVHDVKGFGLGLNYVKEIVDKHHGHINVKSEPQKGSTFKITIPKKHEKQS